MREGLTFDSCPGAFRCAPWPEVEVLIWSSMCEPTSMMCVPSLRMSLCALSLIHKRVSNSVSAVWNDDVRCEEGIAVH